MSKEQWILVLIWAVCLSLYAVVPKIKRREFVLALLTIQGMKWLVTFMLVKYGLISFPIREFPKATDLGFTLQAILMPTLSSAYSIWQPNRSLPVRMIASAIFLLLAALLYSALAAYTELIKYDHYAWYWAWICFFALFWITETYSRWFFRSSCLRAEREAAR